MKQLKLIISNEFLTDIKSKSFWLTTFLMPLITVLFGVVVGLLATQSEAMTSVSDSLSGIDSDADLTGSQIYGMLMGIVLTMFIMVYGANIFNKVKAEKCNRIVEIMATCVDGRTMMLGKIISVGLIGLTQIFVWGFILAVFAIGAIMIFDISAIMNILTDSRIWLGLIWGIAFFIGGYVFFGSLYAACGAMSDKNNENQEYMTVVTFILMLSFYMSQFVVDNGGSTVSICMTFIPFTSPSIGAVNAVTGANPLWMSLLSLIVLYFFAWLALSISGKIYTSSILLKGKKFTPRDIVLFIKMK